MSEQNTLRLVGVFIGLLCFTTPILGETKSHGLIRDKDADTSLLPTSCVLNSRTGNPLNPRTFFKCTVTGSTLMKCPDSMVFEASSGTCIEDDARISDQYPPNCARATNGAFFPSYTNCRNFWRCNFQRAILFTCGEGEYWSQDNFTCVYPKDANCQIIEDDEEIKRKSNLDWKHPILQQLK